MAKRMCTKMLQQPKRTTLDGVCCLGQCYPSIATLRRNHIQGEWTLTTSPTRSTIFVIEVDDNLQTLYSATTQNLIK